MRVATYSRVSTSDKAQRPEVQVEELRRFCVARGWQISHEIVDHGYSGSVETRPGLKKLMALVRAREVDAVVVVKLDRLFRSLKHLVVTLDELCALGVTFVATADAVDFSTPSGRLLIQILGSLSEFEKALLVERTKLGLEYARRHGKRLGRPKRRNDQLIARLHDQGLSYSEIQRKVGCTRSAIYRALKAISKTRSRSEFQVAEKARHKKVR